MAPSVTFNSNSEGESNTVARPLSSVAEDLMKDCSSDYLSHITSRSKARKIAKNIERHFNNVEREKRLNPVFIKHFRNLILTLHEDNNQIALFSRKYPKSPHFERLLRLYISLECELTTHNSILNKNEIKNRLLRFLKIILYDIFKADGYSVKQIQDLIYRRLFKYFIDFLNKLRELNVENAFAKSIIEELIEKQQILKNNNKTGGVAYAVSKLVQQVENFDSDSDSDAVFCEYKPSLLLKSYKVIVPKISQSQPRDDLSANKTETHYTNVLKPLTTINSEILNIINQTKKQQIESLHAEEDKQERGDFTHNYNRNESREIIHFTESTPCEDVTGNKAKESTVYDENEKSLETVTNTDMRIEPITLATEDKTKDVPEVDESVEENTEKENLLQDDNTELNSKNEDCSNELEKQYIDTCAENETPQGEQNDSIKEMELQIQETAPLSDLDGEIIEKLIIETNSTASDEVNIDSRENEIGEYLSQDSVTVLTEDTVPTCLSAENINLAENLTTSYIHQDNRELSREEHENEVLGLIQEHPGIPIEVATQCLNHDVPEIPLESGVNRSTEFLGHEHVEMAMEISTKESVAVSFDDQNNEILAHEVMESSDQEIVEAPIEITAQGTIEASNYENVEASIETTPDETMETLGNESVETSIEFTTHRTIETLPIEIAAQETIEALDSENVAIPLEIGEKVSSEALDHQNVQIVMEIPATNIAEDLDHENVQIPIESGENEARALVEHDIVQNPLQMTGYETTEALQHANVEIPIDRAKNDVIQSLNQDQNEITVSVDEENVEINTDQAITNIPTEVTDVGIAPYLNPEDMELEEDGENLAATVIIEGNVTKIEHAQTEIPNIFTQESTEQERVETIAGNETLRVLDDANIEIGDKTAEFIAHIDLQEETAENLGEIDMNVSLSEETVQDFEQGAVEEKTEKLPAPEVVVNSNDIITTVEETLDIGENDKNMDENSEETDNDISLHLDEESIDSVQDGVDKVTIPASTGSETMEIEPKFISTEAEITQLVEQSIEVNVKTLDNIESQVIEDNAAAPISENIVEDETLAGTWENYPQGGIQIGVSTQEDIHDEITEEQVKESEVIVPIPDALVEDTVISSAETLEPTPEDLSIVQEIPVDGYKTLETDPGCFRTCKFSETFEKLVESTVKSIRPIDESKLNMLANIAAESRMNDSFSSLHDNITSEDSSDSKEKLIIDESKYNEDTENEEIHFIDTENDEKIQEGFKNCFKMGFSNLEASLEYEGCKSKMLKKKNNKKKSLASITQELKEKNVENDRKRGRSSSSLDTATKTDLKKFEEEIDEDPVLLPKKRRTTDSSVARIFEQEIEQETVPLKKRNSTDTQCKAAKKNTEQEPVLLLKKRNLSEMGRKSKPEEEEITPIAKKRKFADILEKIAEQEETVLFATKWEMSSKATKKNEEEKEIALVPKTAETSSKLIKKNTEEDRSLLPKKRETLSKMGKKITEEEETVLVPKKAETPGRSVKKNTEDEETKLISKKVETPSRSVKKNVEEEEANLVPKQAQTPSRSVNKNAEGEEVNLVPKKAETVSRSIKKNAEEEETVLITKKAETPSRSVRKNAEEEEAALVPTKVETTSKLTKRNTDDEDASLMPNKRETLNMLPKKNTEESGMVPKKRGIPNKLIKKNTAEEESNVALKTRETVNDMVKKHTDEEPGLAPKTRDAFDQLVKKNIEDEQPGLAPQKREIPYKLVKKTAEEEELSLMQKKRESPHKMVKESAEEEPVSISKKSSPKKKTKDDIHSIAENFVFDSQKILLEEEIKTEQEEEQIVHGISEEKRPNSPWIIDFQENFSWHTDVTDSLIGFGGPLPGGQDNDELIHELVSCMGEKQVSTLSRPQPTESLVQKTQHHIDKLERLTTPSPQHKMAKSPPRSTSMDSMVSFTPVPSKLHAMGRGDRVLVEKLPEVVVSHLSSLATTSFSQEKAKTHTVRPPIKEKPLESLKLPTIAPRRTDTRPQRVQAGKRRATPPKREPTIMSTKNDDSNYVKSLDDLFGKPKDLFPKT